VPDSLSGLPSGDEFVAILRPHADGGTVSVEQLKLDESPGRHTKRAE
jgi:hypothetical protein